MTWTEETFERLVAAEPEPLVSRMRVTHAMLLNVIARGGDPFAGDAAAAARQPRGRPQPGPAGAAGRRASTASLLAAGVVERVDLPDGDGRTVRLVEDLQPDFALNQPLSTFALAAFDVLDPESETYALDVVSVIEATLEDPRPVLARAGAQGARRGGRGDEGRRASSTTSAWSCSRRSPGPSRCRSCSRRPTRSTARSHPWVAEDAALAEVGGARHVRAGDDLRGVRRVLRPRPLRGARAALPRRRLPGAAADRARTARAPTSSTTSSSGSASVVRQTDSSLLDEWEALIDPEPVPVEPDPLEPPAPPALTAQRAGVHGAGAQRDVPPGGAGRPARWQLGELDRDWTGADAGLGARRWRRTSTSTTRSAPARTPAGRGCCWSRRRPGTWQVQQIVDDPEGDHDWRDHRRRRPGRLRRGRRARPATSPSSSSDPRGATARTGKRAEDPALVAVGGRVCPSGGRAAQTGR